MAPLLTNVIRLDSLPLMKAQMTPEGYLTDRPILTTTGIFEYHNPDGSVRRELRLPEDVFDPESLKSYKGRPIIITHDAGLIDKDNVKKNAIGTILSEGYRSGNDVRAEIIIHDTDRMKDCGLKELSLGYNLDLDETPGVWNGQPYDAVQKNIRINHLALVAEARAGEQARLNIDGRDKSIPKGDQNMKKTRKNYRHGDAQLSPEELAKAIEEYKAKHTEKANEEEQEPVVSTAPPSTFDGDDGEGEPAIPAATEENTDDEDEISKLKALVDALLAEKDFCAAKGGGEEDIPPKEASAGSDTEQDEDEETAEPKMNADSVDRIVRQRIQMGMMGRKLHMDGLENMKIVDAKKSIIHAVRPNLRLDGKSAAYINTAYDFAVAEIEAQAERGTGYQKRQMFNQDSAKQGTTDTDSADSARQRMIDRQMNKNKEVK